MILQIECHNFNNLYFIYIWTLIQLLTSIHSIYVQELKSIFSQQIHYPTQLPSKSYLNYSFSELYHHLCFILHHSWLILFNYFLFFYLCITHFTYFTFILFSSLVHHLLFPSFMHHFLHSCLFSSPPILVSLFMQYSRFFTNGL